MRLLKLLCIIFLIVGLIIAFGAAISLRTVIEHYMTTRAYADDPWRFVGVLLVFNLVVTVAAAANAIITCVIGFRSPNRKTALIFLGALNIFTMPIGMIFANIVFNVHLDWRLLSRLPSDTFIFTLIACVAIPVLFVICVIAMRVMEGKK